MRALGRAAFFLLCFPFFLPSLGCRNKTDVVESQLRVKDTMYREALDDQRRSEAQIIALHREIQALREGAKVTPEQAAATFGLKRIVLGRATGAFDRDDLPGDEILQIVVEPRDESDHLVKAPGCLQILALEVTPGGVKTPLCSWDIGAEQLRQSWKQGLLSTGYTLTLPWKNLPTTEQIRVIVRLVTSDQRLYEADKDIKVKLVPGAVPKRMEMIPPAGPTIEPSTSGYRATPTTWQPAAKLGTPTPLGQ